MDTQITLIVNGTEKTVVTDPQRSLLDVLREDLHLTGPKADVDRIARKTLGIGLEEIERAFK